MKVDQKMVFKIKNLRF